VDQLPKAFEEFYPSLNHWFAVRLLPIGGGLAAYFQDITERVATEATLRQEQEFLNVLLDNVQAGIVACDAEGRLKLFNRAARSFHGIPEQPLPPDQWATQYDLYRADGETPMRVEDIPLYQAWRGQSVQNLEMMIVPKQGSPRLLLASGQSIHTSDGKPQGAVVVMHDITERKQIETALQEREAQLLSVFQTIPDGIMILAATGQIVAANSAAERILNLTRNDISGREYNDSIWSITTVDGKPFPDEALPFAQVMRTGKPVYGVEHAVAMPTGQELSFPLTPLRYWMQKDILPR
jgi:PAS domain S-box-containing protein